MTYELEIKEGKEKTVISFLKQLDFIKVRAVKKPEKQKSESSTAAILGNSGYPRTFSDPPARRSFKDFAGMMSDEDADELGKIIEEGCEKINPEIR